MYHSRLPKHRGEPVRRGGFSALGTIWFLFFATLGAWLIIGGHQGSSTTQAAASATDAAPMAARQYECRRIEDIRIGDYVLAKNPTDLGSPTGHKVVALPRNYTEHVVRLVVASADARSSEIRCTRGHPFWTMNRGWVLGKDLRRDDVLQDERSRPVRVVSAQVQDCRSATYNLTVAGVHTYYVEADGHGILVHNSNGDFGQDNSGQYLFPWAPPPSTHGNSLDSSNTTYLYRRNDAAGNLQKWGITQDNPIEGRYGASLGTDTMIQLDSGTRREMAAKERFLTETMPGPMNDEPWAGARSGETVPLTINGAPCP